MDKKYLLELMSKKEFDELKEILANEIVKPSDDFYDSSEDESTDIVVFNGKEEQWKEFGYKYKVSDFGRIKYRDTNYIIPQCHKDKNLYLDRSKWEEKCNRLNLSTVKISNEEEIYYKYIGPVWLDEIKEGEIISERMLAEKVFAERFNNNPKESLVIHHINNSEKDNRVQNLIYLPNTFHLEIHAYAKARMPLL